jgi:hypothetical protein
MDIVSSNDPDEGLSVKAADEPGEENPAPEPQAFQVLLFYFEIHPSCKFIKRIYHLKI